METAHVYLLGFLVFVVGLAAAAYLLGAPLVWIAVGLVVLVGVGIMAASGRRGSTAETRHTTETRRLD
jgi:hypothetical protein